MFTWRPELQTQVEADYMHVCQPRLKDHANKAVGKKPMWMSNERRKDPNFVARSQRNTNNVKGIKKVGTKLAPRHHQGSISSIELAYRLKSQNGGVMPTAVELFLQSHSKKEGSKRVLSTDKANKVHAEYETRVSEYKEQGVEKKSNAIFYEVVGGHKKGHVYGLGDSASLYFERPSAKRSSTLLRHPLDHIREIERARDEYIQMIIGLTQEREKINEGWEILRKEKEEWSRHMTEEREMIFVLRKHYHSLMRRTEQLESEDRCRDHFAPTSRDPRDPFDGSSGASSFFPIS